MQRAVIEKYDFAIFISSFTFFHVTKFDFRNFANIVPFKAFENHVQTIFDSDFTFHCSANTQMDNDVTPVYLAAQVSHAESLSASISGLNCFLLSQEGHLDVLKFLVESGGSLYVRILIRVLNS